MFSSIKTGYDYLQKVPVEKRKEESARIRTNHPNRVPVVILQHTTKNHEIPKLDKYKYLVPSDLTVGQFLYVLRKRLQLTSEKAIFLFADRSYILPPPVFMELIYSQYASKDDGFLYLTLSGENSFG